MTDRPWTFEHYRSSGQEGHATVPGGVLKYRLTGPATAANVVVFENGWSAPFPYAMWLEQALAPHVRVLSYDRAGIGDSRSPAAMTPDRKGVVSGKSVAVRGTIGGRGTSKKKKERT